MKSKISKRNVAGSVLLLLALGTVSGCAATRDSWGVKPGKELHLSRYLEQGDAQRRASMRLVLKGLDADARGESRLAQGDYERALQVDAVNPYVYLALARHHANGEHPKQTFQYLDRAGSLLGSDEAEAPEMQAVLLGIRGVALRSIGRYEEGLALIKQARAIAPVTWEDGVLSASELR